MNAKMRPFSTCLSLFLFCVVFPSLHHHARIAEAKSSSSSSSSSSAPGAPPYGHINRNKNGGVPSRPSRPFRLHGRAFSTTSDDGDDNIHSWVGMGREFDLFDTRRKSSDENTAPQSSSTFRERLLTPDDDDDDDEEKSDYPNNIDEYNIDVNDEEKSKSEQKRTARHIAGFRTVNGGSINDDSVEQGGSFPRHRKTQFTSSGARVGGAFRESSSSSSPLNGNRYYRRSQQQQQRPYSIFQPVTNWWTTNISPNIKNWPKIQIRVEPTTTLKIRKTFRPLKTIVRLGADFNTQLGVWQFRSSWEDEIIGGKLTLAGRELQLTKSWQLSVGAVEDLVTRLRFRAAVDLRTWKAYARVGFRTERLSPINVMEGFTLQKQIPLDGADGHIKLQVKANFALPEPEIEYSTETHRSLVGMGDIEVNIEELNLLLDY